LFLAGRGDAGPARPAGDILATMSTAADELWRVTRDAPAIDADTLVRALEAVADSPDPLDVRTRLLVRDSLRALETHRGAEWFHAWLARSPRRHRLGEVAASMAPSDEFGFPYLAGSIVDAIRPDTVFGEALPV
jgi:hypothetical protein